MLLTNMTAENITNIMNHSLHIIVNHIESEANESDQANDLEIGQIISDDVHARL